MWPADDATTAAGSTHSATEKGAESFLCPHFDLAGASFSFILFELHAREEVRRGGWHKWKGVPWQ